MSGTLQETYEDTPVIDTAHVSSSRRSAARHRADPAFPARQQGPRVAGVAGEGRWPSTRSRSKLRRCWAACCSIRNWRTSICVGRRPCRRPRKHIRRSGSRGPCGPNATSNGRPRRCYWETLRRASAPSHRQLQSGCRAPALDRPAEADEFLQCTQAMAELETTVFPMFSRRSERSRRCSVRRS